MTANIRLLGIALAALLAPAAWSAGSAEAGATKAATCLACHGPNGNSVNPEWPRLAGQNAAYLRTQLHLWHDAKRVDASGLMPPMAATLSDQDIEDLAAYYAQQAPAGLEAEASNWQAGQRLYQSGDRARQVPACAACHGPAGAGNPVNGYPALRAQYSVYTVKQLTNYAAGTRYTADAKGNSSGGTNAAIMHAIALRLSPDDMHAVASYVQGLR
jgi:cytochrome c553